MENYVVMNGNTGKRDYLIHKTVYQKQKMFLVDIMKIRRLATKDDLFDIIREHYLMKSNAVK
jgi:hypothetical protein